MTEKELKEIFSKNLSYYRKNAGMTQIQLAQRLNYSDKSISKWERGEGLPDVFVLLELSNIFNIDVDNLLNKDRKSKEVNNDVKNDSKDEDKKQKRITYHRIIITCLSVIFVCMVLLIGIASYFVPKLIYPENKLFDCFVVTLPISFIVTVVYTNIWWNRFWQFLSVSGLIWSLSYCVFYFIDLRMVNAIFIVAGILQILAIGWYMIKD